LPEENLSMLRKAFIGLIRGYQLMISPHFSTVCRFTPSCSNYGMEAIQKYGVFRGGILTAWRILRCNPWGAHGYDPPRWFGEPADNSLQHDGS